MRHQQISATLRASWLATPNKAYEQIQVTIKAIGDFDDNQLAELASLTRYSPVRDIVSNPVPIAIDLTRA
jgi:uncharacterized OsmC-like protein